MCEVDTADPLNDERWIWSSTEREWRRDDPVRKFLG